MASIYKRKNTNGSTVWRAVVRIKGHPTVCNHFDRKQKADDWANDTETRIKLGQFNFSAHNKFHTYKELIDRMQADGVFSHHRSLKNCASQFSYWKTRLGSYAVTHITQELIAEERKFSRKNFFPVGQHAVLQQSTAIPRFFLPR